ncbi:MAG: Ig-like domain-containing protein [Putridiphycobacter sp.]|nr:Ig-like domain-containing protein [Putridiphycobacter sp.]
MKTVAVILLSTLLYSCAQISGLTGGEKDTVAPKIITEKSIPQQGQLNYTDPIVELVYDEFIVLKSPLSNISITPQPSVAPTITSKNKKLRIIFNEPLLPSTTYSISFNGAVTDLNEGNDSVFQYVFSTGSFIDSLQFSGTVTDSYTNERAANILVGLYPIHDSIAIDSVPYKTKPTYIGQTDKLGTFSIKYIKTGRYQAYAFSDNDRNLLFNPNTEKIGFITNLECCNTTISDTNNFKIFAPFQESAGLKSSTLNYPGQLILVFKNKEPKNLSIQSDYVLTKEPTERKDSVIYWLQSPYLKQTSFVVEHDGLVDTIQPIMKNLPKNSDVATLIPTNNFVENKVLANDTLTITFNEPIQINDKLGIKALSSDSSIINCRVIPKGARQLSIIPEDSAKYIQIDSAAIHAVLSNAVNNAILLNYEKHEKTFYGHLKIDITSDSSVNLIVELLDMKGKVISKKTNINTYNGVHFSNLIPGNYQLRLIEDTDKNGRWSTGNIQLLQQPEAVFYYDGTIKVRSNWDLEIEWIIAIQ